jgi:hypothetical protein
MYYLYFIIYVTEFKVTLSRSCLAHQKRKMNHGLLVNRTPSESMLLIFTYLVKFELLRMLMRNGGVTPHHEISDLRLTKLLNIK